MVSFERGGYIPSDGSLGARRKKQEHSEACHACWCLCERAMTYSDERTCRRPLQPRDACRLIDTSSDVTGIEPLYSDNTGPTSFKSWASASLAGASVPVSGLISSASTPWRLVCHVQVRNSVAGTFSGSSRPFRMAVSTSALTSAAITKTMLTPARRLHTRL